MGIIISKSQKSNERIDNFIKEFCGEDTFVSNILADFSTFCDLCFIDRKLLVGYGLAENRVDEFIQKFAQYAYPEFWNMVQKILNMVGGKYDQTEMFLKSVSKFYDYYKDGNKDKNPLLDESLLTEWGIEQSDRPKILDFVKQMQNTKETIYISVDVETTGMSPATSSMVMLGVVAFKDVDVNLDTGDSEWIIDRKHWCLEEIENRPMTTICYDSFWSKQTSLWYYIKRNALAPTEAMTLFAKWYGDLAAKYNCIFVARPASFDWQWINCVYDEFGPRDKPVLPYSIRCISSMAKIFDLLNLNSTYNTLIAHNRFKLSHNAEDDAVYQAYMYIRITYWIKSNFTKG